MSPDEPICAGKSGQGVAVFITICGDEHAVSFVGVGGFGDLIECGLWERSAGVVDGTGLSDLVDVDCELSVDACDCDRYVSG